MRPSRSVIVAGTPRSGSTLVCRGLAATGLCGEPEEYFGADVEPRWQERFGLPDGYTLDDLTRGVWTTATHGTVAVKLHWHHLVWLMSRQADLDAMFPNATWVLTHRWGRAAQALSYVQAINRGEWERPAGVPGIPAGEVDVDWGHVRYAEQVLDFQQQSWLTWLRLQGIRPMSVVYDEMRDSPDRKLRELAQHLDVLPSRQWGWAPNIGRQSGDVEAAWLAKYSLIRASIEPLPIPGLTLLGPTAMFSPSVVHLPRLPDGEPMRGLGYA